MNRALRNVGWRYLLRHPWQTGLMILGIALGVSVMVAIDLANSAASRAFDLSTDAIAGRATHQIIGGPAGLDEAVYTRLRTEGVLVAAAPVVTDYVTSPQLGGRPIQLLGVDPFAEAPFRSYLVGPGSGGAPRGSRGAGGAEPGTLRGAWTQLMAFLTKPGALLISEGLAAENGLALGDPIMLDAGGRQSTGFVAGLLHPGDALSRRALDGLILADLATAQEITGRIGRLDAIDLILRERRPDRFRKPVRSAASRRPDRTGAPPFGRAGADDRRVPHEPDCAQPAGAGRRHVSDLQQHDFLGGAAPAAFRHAALPGCDARRDRRPGVGRGGDGRRARFAARPRRWA